MYYFIINKDSGTSRTLNLKQLQEDITEIARRNGRHEQVVVVSASTVEQAIKTAIAAQPAAIIVGGGDGTINTSVGLLQDTGIALGILPLGTFNLAARDHGLCLDPIIALDQLCNARIKSIALMRINARPCLCTATIGFYPRLIKILDQFKHTKWWIRTLQIVWNSAFYFTRCPAYRFSVSGDAAEKINNSRMIIIVPGGYADVIGLIPQRSTYNPDAFSIYIFKHLGRFAIIRSIAAFISGRINNNPDIQVVNSKAAVLQFARKKHIKIMIDGEIMQLSNPLRVELVTDSLKILLPTDTSA